MRISTSTLLLALVSSGSAFSFQPSLLRRSSATCAGRLFSAAAPPAEGNEVYGTQIGDTKGAALRLANVAISRGASPLLKNIDWSVQAGERWGIVGINGAGKSTLLGAITGTVRMDEGQALVHSKIRVGYLKQSAVSGSKSTVYEESKSEMVVIEEARERLEKASKIVEDGDFTEVALEDLADAQEQFQIMGGYEQEQMVDSVLKGLGFEPEDSNRLCSDFSGGWQMRIALARYVRHRPHAKSYLLSWLITHRALYSSYFSDCFSPNHLSFCWTSLVTILIRRHEIGWESILPVTTAVLCWSRTMWVCWMRVPILLLKLWGVR
jgi:ABC-type Mn2+/Zn2+ transport system ATPase subunit